MPESEAVSTAPDMKWRLAEFSGHPVRVTILDPVSHERLMRLSGLLSAVDSSAMTVDCLHPLNGIPASAPVTIEILQEGQLFFCHTQLCRDLAPERSSLRCALPLQVQTTQRRRYPRVDLEVPVHVVLPEGGQVVGATLRDISVGGASLKLRTALPEKSRVALVFQLGSGFYFQNLEAECVRCTTSPDGIYVIGLRLFCHPDQAVSLAGWVSRQLEG